MTNSSSWHAKEMIEKEIMVRIFSSFIPEELLRDGLSPQHRAILADVAVASLMIFCMLLPNWLFKPQYKRELRMLENAEDIFDASEVEFTKD